MYFSLESLLGGKECGLTGQSLTGSLFSFLRYQFSDKSLKKTKRVAVIATHLGNDRDRQIVFSYIESVTSVVDYKFVPIFDIFTARNSAKALHEEALWYLRDHTNEYSAVVTIGAIPSLITYQVQKEWECAIPQFFVDVPDPSTIGLVRPDGKSDGVVTGVCGVFASYDEPVKLLKGLRGKAFRVLAPFDGTRIDKMCNTDISLRDDKLNSVLEAEQYAIKEVPLFAHTDVCCVIGRELSRNEILLLNTDSPVTVHTKKYVDMCNQKRVTMFASSLNAVREGAALGFGSDGSLLARHAAHQMYQFLVENIDIEDISVLSIEESLDVRFNPRTLNLQGLRIPEVVRQALDARSIYVSDF